MTSPDGPKAPWYAGLPDVEAQIECQGSTHRLLWRAGELLSLDHDADSERALVALGGEECECLQAVRGWTARHEMGELLTLTYYRGISSETYHGSEVGDQLRLSAERNLEMLGRLLQHLAQAGLSSPASGKRSVEMKLDLDRSRCLRSLTLAGEEVLRRALGDFIDMQTARWSENGPPKDSSMMSLSDFMSNNLTPALEDSIRSWRRLDPGVVVTVEAWLDPPFTDPSVFGWVSHHGGFAGVTVGLDWVTSVLLEGISVVDGCFVLQRISSAEDRSWHEVRAVRWEPQWDGSSQSLPGQTVEKLDRYFADRWTPCVASARLSRKSDGWQLAWGRAAGDQ